MDEPAGWGVADIHSAVWQIEIGFNCHGLPDHPDNLYVELAHELEAYRFDPVIQWVKIACFDCVTRLKD